MRSNHAARAAPRDADLPDEGRAYVEHVATPDPLRKRSGGSRPTRSSELAINRPPTGGDLTFSWKEGHICTVVLLEVLSQPDALAPEAARRAQR